MTAKKCRDIPFKKWGSGILFTLPYMVIYSSCAGSTKDSVGFFLRQDINMEGKWWWGDSGEVEDEEIWVDLTTIH